MIAYKPITRHNVTRRAAPLPKLRGGEHGFTIVDPIMASVVIAIAVFLAVSGTGYVVQSIKRANDRGRLDADMQSYAGLIKEKANLFHYCGAGYTVDDSGCNGGVEGESKLYFHQVDATADLGDYPMDEECNDGTLREALQVALDGLPVPSTIESVITVDDSLLVNIELKDKKNKLPPRLVKIYPAVASFCPT